MSRCREHALRPLSGCLKSQVTLYYIHTDTHQMILVSLVQHEISTNSPHIWVDSTLTFLIMKISVQVIFLLSTLYALESTWERVSWGILWSGWSVSMPAGDCLDSWGGQAHPECGGTISWAEPWHMKKASWKQASNDVYCLFSLCLYLPGVESSGMCHHAQFMWCWESNPWASWMLGRQHQLSHSPSSWHHHY